MSDFSPFYETQTNEGGGDGMVAFLQSCLAIAFIWFGFLSYYEIVPKDVAPATSAVVAMPTEAPIRTTPTPQQISDKALRKYAEAFTKKAKQKQVNELVSQYANVAVSESKKYGIPAAVTLSQAILETNAGQSYLRRNANNFFGIKCPPSVRCEKGHCINRKDDTHKDFFRVYKTPWESFRHHSKLLQNKRYSPLKEYPKTDYKAWCHGLKKCGYATDKRYGSKLIFLIEYFNLTRFDEN